MNCGVRVPSFITSYTGISQQMVDDAPDVNHVMRAGGRLLLAIRPWLRTAPASTSASICANAGSWASAWWSSRSSARCGCHDACIHNSRATRWAHWRMHCKLKHCGAAHRAAADAETTAELMMRLGRDIGAMHEGLTLTHEPAAPPDEHAHRAGAVGPREALRLGCPRRTPAMHPPRPARQSAGH